MYDMITGAAAATALLTFIYSVLKVHQLNNKVELFKQKMPTIDKTVEGLVKQAELLKDIAAGLNEQRKRLADMSDATAEAITAITERLEVVEGKFN
jgi:hypothetical protein